MIGVELLVTVSISFFSSRQSGRQSRWLSRPLSGWQFQPTQGIPPQFVFNQFRGASRSTVSRIVSTIDMTPAIRWDELHDMQHMIANEGLESTRISDQPAEDNGAVSPRVDTLRQYIQCLLGVVEEPCK